MKHLFSSLWLATLLCFSIVESGFTQPVNLVLNGSFENYTGELPKRLGSFSSAETIVDDWFNPSTGSPDYFHQNATISSYNGLTTDWKPTENWLGSQAAKHGKATAAIHTYRARSRYGYWGVMREYIATKLLKPLTVGESYVITLYVSRCDFTEAATSIGVLFYDPKKLYQYTVIYDGIETEPQLYTDFAIQDKDNWIEVKFNYTADIPFEYMAIGNFFYIDNGGTYVDERMLNQNLYPNDTFKYRLDASYYIDDVSIYAEPMPQVNIGPDVTICSNRSVTLSSNVVGHRYLWSTGDTTSSLEVKDQGDYWLNVYRFDQRVSDTVTVTVINAPDKNLAESMAVCKSYPLNIVLDAGAAGFYEWSIKDSTSRYLTADLPGTYSVICRNENGCFEEDTIIITDNCPDCGSELIVFPNPVYDKVSMRVVANDNDPGVPLRIYAQNGQKVFESIVNITKGDNDLMLALPQLPQALYYIQLNLSCGVIKGKFMVSDSR
jgi:hypothetical protein